ncbi:hypothetical protein BOX15_Mlig029922g4 [Macrostomum lignano]|uniref:Protein YIPF n=1 Tax=Macrostomum lignano TaxID=282301 RepID=A0A267E218_9PLAT|nr:hypothetical protein BOX15_Mlig029922g4 [Macrostomum lignano]
MSDNVKEQISIDFHQSDHASLPVEGILSSASVASTVQSSSSISANIDAEPSTIDEPVRATILRDVKAIGNKFLLVFVPRSSRALIKDWDLWGPLILCTILALLLQGHSSSSSSSSASHDGGPQFAQVFIIYWAGAAAVTLNAQLLSQSNSSSGTKPAPSQRPPGFLQSVCVLGYCVLPLLLALIFSQLAVLVIPSGAFLVSFILRCLFTAASLVWSVYSASVAFLPVAESATAAAEADAASNPQQRVLFANRRFLVAYPIGLFYIVLAWLVLSGSG